MASATLFVYFIYFFVQYIHSYIHSPRVHSCIFFCILKLKVTEDFGTDPHPGPLVRGTTLQVRGSGSASGILPTFQGSRTLSHTYIICQISKFYSFVSVKIWTGLHSLSSAILNIERPSFFVWSNKSIDSSWPKPFWMYYGYRIYCGQFNFFQIRVKSPVRTFFDCRIASQFFFAISLLSSPLFYFLILVPSSYTNVVLLAGRAGRLRLNRENESSPIPVPSSLSPPLTLLCWEEILQIFSWTAICLAVRFLFPSYCALGPLFKSFSISCRFATI